MGPAECSITVSFFFGFRPGVDFLHITFRAVQLAFEHRLTVQGLRALRPAYRSDRRRLARSPAITVGRPHSRFCSPAAPADNLLSSIKGNGSGDDYPPRRGRSAPQDRAYAQLRRVARPDPPARRVNGKQLGSFNNIPLTSNLPPVPALPPLITFPFRGGVQSVGCI